MSWRARALLCDLDGVIRHWAGHGRARGEQAASLPAGAIRKLGYGMEFTLANLGVYTHQQWLTSVGKLLAQHYGPGADAAISVWDDDPGALDPDMMALLHRVKDGGTPLGLLTNNTTALRRDLARHQLTDLFTVVVNSAEVEVVKPAPLIYRIATRELGVAPESIVFVDDTLTNVLAARHIGMQAEQFTGIEDFAQLLVDTGIPMPEPSGAAGPAEPTRSAR